MKKLIYSSLILIAGLAVFYISLPYLGINIAASELFGRSLPFLKENPPNTLAIQTGFEIKPYAQGLDVPRFMYITAAGDLLVAEPYKGRITLIPDQKPQQKRVLLANLTKPHSMDVQGDYLYVAEENAIGRIHFDGQKGTTQGKHERLITNIPNDGGHWTRTIKFGPDGYAYVSIGSSCNVCIEKNPLRATISRFKPGDKQLTVYATGLRNSVGFDWSPVDGQLYAVENSRDWLGDHFPPEELNRVCQYQFYGWPYANGDRIPDPDFGQGKEALIAESQPPLFKLDPHTAPLGITFIKNPASPLYQQALVALHGSWNSSKKVGYKVVKLNFNQGKITQQDFITGFLKQGKVSGRPVHVVEGKHGELYLSDDYGGVVYIITGQPHTQFPTVDH